MDNEINKNGINEEEEITEELAEVAEAETESEEEAAETQAVEEEEPDTDESEETAENEEIAEEAAEEDEDSLCILCGERIKNEESDYCSECEAAMYKRKIPFLAWISGIAVICVSIFALVVSMLVSAPVLQAARGDTYAAKNRWYAAYLEYSEVSSVVDEISGILGAESPFVKAGRAIDEKIVISYAKSRSPLDAVYMATMLYGETAVKEMSGISEYVELYDEFSNNYALLAEPIDAMLAGAELNETFAALEALEGADGVNEVYRNYFLFSAADFYKLGYQEQLKYIEAADAAAEQQSKDFSWLYYLEIADILCQEGEYDKALKYADVLAENDKNNYRAHDLKMRIALAKGDADTASKILADFKTNNEGFDTAQSLEAGYLRATGNLENSRLIIKEGIEMQDSSPELHRQLALLYLLEENWSAAFEEAFLADSNASYLANYYMDSSGFTPQLDNTLYLCAKLCKEKNLTVSENAAYIDTILDYYAEFEPSKQVASILNGEKTVNEVLTEGVCDLA
ncbi:MAG: hypothetical protein IJE74_00430 [Clostridia bacterium]|nr:hypothetical protein [Clostridia bacterium]